MSKRTAPHRVVLSDWKAKKAEEGAIDIVVGDRTFRVPPMELWPDDAVAALTAANYVDAISGGMGADEFADFVALGGSAIAVATILNDVQGASAGE